MNTSKLIHLNLKKILSDTINNKNNKKIVRGDSDKNILKLKYDKKLITKRSVGLIFSICIPLHDAELTVPTLSD